MKNPSFAQLVACLLPLALTVTPQTFTAENGHTYYYVVCQLPNQAQPMQTQPFPTPLGAYRYARKALLYAASKLVAPIVANA